MTDALTATLDEIVAQHVASMSFDRLPASTVAATKRLMLDTLGAGLAGRTAEGCDELRALVERWGGAPEARLFSSGPAVPAHHAALVNSTMARALEIDDVHENGLLHSTVSIVPVALATVDSRPGADGRDLLTAVATGIDLAARLSLAPLVNTGAGHRPRSMSWTYQTGILVGALVAGKLAGLNADGLRNVLGIAYSQCAGNNQCLLEGALTVRVQQGLSSAAALTSVALHEIGITGTRDSLSGEHGYFAAFHRNEFDPSPLHDGLGTSFEVEQVSIKPYPCCKFTHTAIAAALEAREQIEDLDDVDRVVAHVNSHEYFDTVCRPTDPAARRESLRGERGWVHAQFSLPYVTAVALVKGRVVLSDFTEQARSEERVLAMMDRITTVVDPDALGGPGRRLPTPGLIDVHLRDGQVIRADVSYTRGHPLVPMTYDDVAAKFSSVTTDLGTGRELEQGAAVIGAVADLEKATDARSVMDAVVSA